MRPFRFLLLLLLAATSVLALDVPPKPTTWVTDRAAILSDTEEQSLNQKLETVKQRSGTEILVMTFPSLEGEEVVDYTNRVANQWQVKDDKALMLFVFVQDRKTWIQVGYGLEGVITDAIASRVYRQVLVPHFREQKYYEGIDAAINDLVHRIDPKALPDSPAQQRRPVSPAPEAEVGGIPLNLIIFILLFVFFFLVPLFSRRRGCGGCIVPFWFGGGGPGITFGGGGGGGSSFNIGGSWGGGGSSFGGGGAGGSW